MEIFPEKNLIQKYGGTDAWAVSPTSNLGGPSPPAHPLIKSPPVIFGHVAYTSATTALCCNLISESLSSPSFGDFRSWSMIVRVTDTRLRSRGSLLRWQWRQVGL